MRPAGVWRSRNRRRAGSGPREDADALGELRRRLAQVVREDSLARALGDRLHEDRVRQRYAGGVLGAFEARERRCRHTAVSEQLLGPALVQRQREGERVAPRVAHVEVLADGRDVRLAVLPVQAFGHVEDEVGANEGEPVREGFIGFETGDAAETRESTRYRVDGRGLVPLGEGVAGTG